MGKCGLLCKALVDWVAQRLMLHCPTLTFVAHFDNHLQANEEAHAIYLMDNFLG